jgi:hypothetical protein
MSRPKVRAPEIARRIPTEMASERMIAANRTNLFWAEKKESWVRKAQK